MILQHIEILHKIFIFSMTDQQYKIENYTDQELYTILELSSNTPTDGELEARIIQMIQRHKQVQSNSGQKLYQFFIDIYEHFFGEEEKPLDENKSPETIEDESKNEPSEPNSQTNADVLIDTNALNLKKKRTPDKSISANETNDVSLIKSQQYIRGKLNPILKETYNRTISIDSQYRDIEYPSSTDFILHFSEVLKDVVSLKLYAVQIPVTWYTISESYGSNFFFLKPNFQDSNDKNENTLGIYGNANHEYKIEIEPGNYTSSSLVDEVNSKMQTLFTQYLDVNFGNTRIEYNSAQAKSTFHVDLQKTYTELDYDISYTSILQQLFNIPDEHQPTYFRYVRRERDASWNILNPVVSLIQYLPTEQQSNFAVYDETSGTFTTLPIVNQIDIAITNDTQSRSASDWVTEINQRFQENPDLDSASFIAYLSTRDDTNDGIFTWNLKPARERVPPVPNTKWVLYRSPTETAYSNFLGDVYNEVSIHEFSSTTISGEMFLENQSIRFIPKVNPKGGVYIDPTQYPNESTYNDIILNIPNDLYTETSLITKINELLRVEPLTYGSQIESVEDLENETFFRRFRYNINKVFTSRHYSLVFYDIYSFAQCVNYSSGFRNAKIDTTLGYILGFKILSQYSLNYSSVFISDTNGISYFKNPDTGRSTGSVYTYTDLIDSNSGNIIRSQIQLKADAVVSVYLYNYFMIILDDFNQNHMNDGLVTITSRDSSVSLPSYAQRQTSKICDPTSLSVTNTVSNTTGLTQKQIYSVEQILETQNTNKNFFNENASVRDMFALLPVKGSGNTPGSIYVEFGGTLQLQERVYFGPVNIGRLHVKLVNDKGDTVDLNGANWSFQLVCQQLYQGGA